MKTTHSAPAAAVAPLAIAGPYGLADSGLGAAGQVTVVLEQQIEAECYETVELDMIWPTPTSLCGRPE